MCKLAYICAEEYHLWVAFCLNSIKFKLFLTHDYFFQSRLLVLEQRLVMSVSGKNFINVAAYSELLVHVDIFRFDENTSLFGLQILHF